MMSVRSGGTPSVVLFVSLIFLPLPHQQGEPLTAQCQPPRNAEGPDHRSSICHGRRGTPGQPGPGPTQKGRKDPAEKAPFGAEESKKLEIKVVTFNQGRFDPPILEPVRFWPKGHTAVIIDGEVHSFEADWQCGETKAEYKQDNEWRGAWVQVLDVPKSDAKQIQKDFDRSCGTGAFLLTGVCTSSASRLLQNVLTDLKITWAPMRLRGQLVKGGHVDRTYRWHREVWADNVAQCLGGENERARHHPEGASPSKGTLERAHDKCLKLLGLSKEDVPLPLGSSVDAVEPVPLEPSHYNQGKSDRPKSTATPRGREHPPSDNTSTGGDVQSSRGRRARLAVGGRT